MRTDRFFVAAGICLAALSCASAYGQGKIRVIKPKAAPAPAADTQSSEPDKVLYERAITDLKHKRYEEERLSLNVLINTYPDSEYLDKAKLAVADSYYIEGGISNLTQAVGEYKSFIVFFPTDDQAPYAQMQVGMAHYKMMEKSDRDNSEAESAEAELQTFLTRYPDSKLDAEAQQRLRDVQEVIADGEYRVARFYFLRPDYRAATARLVELTERYPLYSQSDEALWMLSNVYSLMRRKGSRNEDDKNHWADLEGKVYDQIIVNYPLSPRAAQAKANLKAMGMPIPASDPAAVARMQKQAAYVRAHRQKSLVKGPMSIVKTGPDFSLAAQSGTPNLDPPTDMIAAKDILSPTAAGPTFGLSARSGTSVSDGGQPVEGTVIPAVASDSGTNSSTSNDENGTVNAPTTSSVASDSPAPSNDPVGQVDAPTTSSTPAAASSTGDAAAPSAASDGPAASQTGSDATQSSNPPATAPPVSNNESSSKKKKGLGKLNPF